MLKPKPVIPALEDCCDWIDTGWQMFCSVFGPSACVFFAAVAAATAATAFAPAVPVATANGCAAERPSQLA